MSHFNEVANEWDNQEKTKMMKLLAQKVLENIHFDKDLKILDFGCGTGLFGLEFEAYTKELLGIDTSDGMLEVFEKKVQGDKRYRTLDINLETDELNEKFDLIVSSMAFHHLNDPEKVLLKLKQSLEKNGKIIIVDLDKEDGTFHPDNEGMGVKHFGFSKEELENWAQKSQLSLNHMMINEIHKNDKVYQQFCATYFKS